MLFNQEINNIDNQLQGYGDRIEELEAQLKLLRTEKGQLEEHKQKLLTAEQAAESALEQVRIAVSLVSTVDTNQVEIFHDAVDNIFTTFNSAPQLEAVVDEEGEEVVIQAEAALEISANNDTEEDNEEEVNIPEKDVLSKEQLHLFTVKKLSILAKDYFALSSEQTAHCKRKDDWVDLLILQEVTANDIKQAFPDDF